MAVLTNLDRRFRVGCRQQTTRTQWPLVVLERPGRWETAESEHQRPDQTGSSRSDFLAHRLPPTSSGRSAFSIAAGQPNPTLCNGNILSGRWRPQPTGQLPTFAVPPERSPRGPVRSETCQTAYKCSSASAAVAPSFATRRQCGAYLPFSLERAKAAALLSGERNLLIS